jgi:predicted GIY-YIG superfamily endonuclease
MQTGRLFHGDDNGCKAFLARRPLHYVYILRRPDGRPFYIGKGVGGRVFQHENEARHPNNRLSNAHKLNVIRAIRKAGGAVTYEIDLLAESAEEAFARETLLIGRFKRLHEGGPLTNRAPGGGSTAGVAPVSKERHAATLSGEPDDNPERAVLNRFILSIAEMRSVVVKPVAQLVAKPTVPFPQKKPTLTLRQAVAVVASASANSVPLDGPCRVPRLLDVEGVAGLVENGVACDLVSSGSATLVPAADPRRESFELSASQAQAIVGLVGLPKCFNLGLLSYLSPA